jgi:hypothetical protein
MIEPKTAKPSAAAEKRAYAIATERDENRCVKCRHWRDVQRDHRQNRMPGNTLVCNLQLLCAGCHRWKTENPQDAKDQGYSVPRWADPREWPATRYLPSNVGTLRRAWVLYDNHGNWVEIDEAEALRRMVGDAA